MKIGYLVADLVLVLAVAHYLPRFMPARAAGQTYQAAVTHCVHANLSGLASAMLSGKNLPESSFLSAASGVGRCGQ